jgi:uncharacterized protein
MTCTQRFRTTCENLAYTDSVGIGKTEVMYTPQILGAPLEPISQPGPPQALWEWGDGDVEVGIWECEPGVMDGRNGDFDEMMCMVSGRVSVTHPDGEWDVAPGTVWVTPRHFRCTWTVHQTVRKMYVIDNRPGTAQRAALMANAHTVGVGNTKPRLATAGNPHESTNVLWANNQLDVGVWECTPGTFAATRIGYDEVFLCLSGRATMTADNGMRFDLAPGSVLYTPAGFVGTWDISETFRKVYCLILGR